MILYFSSTGNCKYVAERLGAAFDDVCESVEKQDPRLLLKEGDPNTSV